MNLSVRQAWRLGTVGLVLAAAIIVWLWPKTAQDRVVPDGKYIFLYVTEYASHSLEVPVYPPPLPRAAWNPETLGLTVARPEDKPRESTQVLLIVDYTNGFIKYRPELHLLETPVKHIPLGKPIKPVNGIPASGINNSLRKVRGDLELLGADPDGSVRLDYAGERIVLQPNTAWSEGLLLEDGEWKVVPKGDKVGQIIEDAITNNKPYSIMYVSHQGMWDTANTHVGRVR